MWLYISIFTLILGLLHLTGAQDILRYSIQEESGDVFIGDIIRDAGLDQEYTQEDLDSMNLVFVESDEAHESLFNLRAGILETKGPVDRDNICPHLDVCVIQMAIKIQPPEFFAIIQVEVVIVDINDNVPTFETSTQEVIISESTTIGSLSNLPQAQDNDSPAFSIQGYDMTPESGVFSLHQVNTGGIVRVQLQVNQRLDREQRDTYSFTLRAIDGGNPIQTSSVDITIIISDSNDNRPAFLQQEYAVNVSESSETGVSIATVTAVDNDIGDNAQIEYAFDDTTVTESGHLFRIDDQTGQIYIRNELDYETKREHTLYVLAKDNDPSFVGARAEIKINVIDYNDNPPAIKINDLLSGESLIVAENEAIGHFVAHLTVIDEDSTNNGQFECSIDDANFILVRLYPTEFKIITDLIFDRELRSQYTIRMTCSDNGNPRQRTEMTIPVIISDKNDQVPTFQSATYVGNTLENEPPGTFIMRVSANDGDLGQNSEIEYHIDGTDAEKFNMGLLSGNISVKVNLDHERQSRYTFTVKALDRGDPILSSTATVIIDIVDVDDSVPLFSRTSYTFSIPEHEPDNTEVGTVLATDADSEPFDRFEYSLERTDFFHIDRNTGLIFTNMELNREEYDNPVFTTEVYAISAGFRPTTSTAMVTIHITDINDFYPEFGFPIPENNTLRVDNDKRRGDVIGYVTASDKDAGNNARLTYSFAGGNQDNYFFIDAADGTILAHQSLASIDDRTFGLVIRVHDGGLPPKASEAFMNIVVNRSASKADDDAAKKTNLAIVLSIACISGFIIVILMVAIAFIIIQRRRQNQRSRYNNVPKVLNGDAFKQQTPVVSSALQSKPTSKMMRSFDNSGFSEESIGDTKNHQQAFHNQRGDAAKDSDQESILSADISNTDSGRGSNEDFNQSKLKHSVSNDSHIVTNPNNSYSNHMMNSKSNSRNINTSHLQAGAYAPNDYSIKHSYDCKNVSHPSPLLDNLQYGDRRRQVLYRDTTKSSNLPSPIPHPSHRRYPELGTHYPDMGPQSDYVVLQNTAKPKNRLHEVHV